MLKLHPNPTFTWPVKFKSPEGEQTLTVVFRHMPKEQYDAWWDAAWKRHIAYQDALRAWAEACATAKAEGKSEPAKPQPEMAGVDELMEIVAGWEDVDAPFSREALSTLLANYHDLNVKRISEAWIEGLQQRKLEN